MRSFLLRIIPLTIFAATFLFLPPAMFGQQGEFDALAARAVERMRESEKKLKIKADSPVMVADFTTAPIGVTHLGAALAEAVRRALTLVPDAPPVLSNTCAQWLISDRGLSEEYLSATDVLVWIGKQCGAAYLITGYVRDRKDFILLTTHLFKTSDGEEINEDSVQLERTDVRVKWLAEQQPLPAALRFAKDVPQAGKEGIGMPICIECPRPKLPLSSFLRQSSGRLVFEVVIDETGRVQQIAPIKGGPFDTVDAAMEAIRAWRFSPAKDAQGKPVKVRSVVEIDFRFR